MPIPELETLRAFDRLLVEGLEVEPRRASARYVVEGAAERTSFELQVKYEEDVFHPADPLDRNLAALLLAQPALNYGLFCDTIRLDLPLDAADLRFLEDAARNTAKDIYCNKSHAGNPFLKPEAASRPFVKRKDYLRAGLEVAVPGGPYRFPGPWRDADTAKSRTPSAGAGDGRG